MAVVRGNLVALMCFGLVSSLESEGLRLDLKCCRTPLMLVVCKSKSV